MMMRSVILVIPIALLLALSVVDGQLSSSSGLVFPGPPRRKSGEEAPGAAAGTRSAHPRPGPPRAALPVPLSLIGQQPEEFVAAAQRRQQQQQLEQQQKQQQQQEAEQRAAQQKQAEEVEEEEEEEEEEPAPQIREQPPTPPAPTSQRRQQQQPEPQKPEPSIHQTVQQRRPNYPANYKPPAQQANAEGPRRPPNVIHEAEAEKEAEEEEEEEVKPDKLQLLLQRSHFSCSEKKDGYYADEEVDCEIFHYCQDRTRHSWLCPEGATFHQVHLLCMPVGKDNICAKSSQFHFVNDYLYKTVEGEDGNNATGIYVDRYYPEGYEQGKEFDMAQVVQPDRPNFQNRRQQAVADQRQRRPVPQQSRNRPHDDRKTSEPRRPPPPHFPIEDDEDAPFNQQGPIFRSQDAFDRRGRPQPDAELPEEDDE